jgi:elongator complex protein 3
MRYIPSRMIKAGPRASDMRNRVQARLRSGGRSCQCIRCREVARASREPGELRPVERSYAVTGGEEVFMSYEDGEGTLAAFLRLSIQDGGKCRVRELHTYGRAVEVGAVPSRGDYQHKGLGRALLSRAEERAGDAGFERLWITSGIGARIYYRGAGYVLEEPYMVRSLQI